MNNDFFTQQELAYHALVKDFRKGQTPSGAIALAPLVGMKSGTLSNKVNPNDDTHLLNVAEGVALQAASQNYAPIMADAATLGGVFTLLPTLGDINDEGILNRYLEIQEEQGKTANKIRTAMADNKITPRELREITKEVFEDIAQYQSLLLALSELSQKGRV